MDKGKKEEIEKLESGFDKFLEELSDREQPEVCNLEDEDCEACGS
jgi:hypothetical protein